MSDDRRLYLQKMKLEIRCGLAHPYKTIAKFIVHSIQGIILNHFVPPKTTVTGNYYATVNKSELLPDIKRKQPQLLRSKILLHHDNAPSHSSHVVWVPLKELDHIHRIVHIWQNVTSGCFQISKISFMVRNTSPERS